MMGMWVFHQHKAFQFYFLFENVRDEKLGKGVVNLPNHVLGLC